MSVRNLEHLFKPASVAVVGASNAPKSVGGLVMRNLLRSGFGGPIMPVNPKYPAVAGVLTYPDIAHLPLTPDLAVLCTPPATVPEIIHQLGQRGTRAAIVITAGLAEQPYTGAENAERAMLAAAKPYTLRILGPNCVGLIVPGLALNATFAHADIGPGSIAFVSQSGGFCTATLDWARPRGIGFSHFISLGNTADVDFGDVLDYLGSDPATTAILLYVESVGQHEGRKFMSAARAASRNKPVIAIKSGRFPEGARAARSHTGALAGADNVYEAALRRAGILRVFTLDELFDAVETLARGKPLQGNRLAILTNGGGPGVIATDALISDGGTLAEFTPETLEKLDALLPYTWSHGNPVDMIGDSDCRKYIEALDIIADDPNVDAVLVMNAPSAIAPPEETARGIVEALHNARRPILTSWVGGEAAQRARRHFAEAGIPTYDTPEDAVRAFMHLVRYRLNQEILTQVPRSLPTDFTPLPGAARAVIEQVLADDRELLTEPEAKQVLAAYGLPVVETRVAPTPPAAAQVAEQIGFPVALKILSPDITHKSDAGGVVLGLDAPDDVWQAAAAMQARASKRFPNAQLAGFTVQKMVRRPQAHELIIGVTTDPVFGPVVLFGRGGTAVEVIADSSTGLPPINMSLARYLIERTQVYKLLKGYRDRPPVNFDALCLALIQVSQLVVDRPEIIELDVNPLFADKDGVIALDARIRVGRAGTELTSPNRLAIRPYPAELEETMRLPSGREVFVRPIRPEDGPLHTEFIARLTPEDLRLRFLGVTREVPPSEMARLTQIDYDREMAFIALAPNAEGQPETLGVVRTLSNPDSTKADFAVMVRSDLKRTGLGTALMHKILGYCRSRGMREIVGEVLAENEAMLSLCRKLGFTVRPLPETGRCEVRLRLE
ncbi:MAG: bifunctional acetate--CoA ligase family protein/GNAT family N-acetyltransferase [Planctomycetota bacterium]